MNSILIVPFCSAPVMSLEDAIKAHRASVLYADELCTHRITVRRGHIFDDAIFSLRAGFDEQKHLRIRFVGEAAVDEGGPRREFFMLLMNAISNNSMLLQGPPDRRLLRHNTSAFQVNLFACDCCYVTPAVEYNYRP